LGDFLFRRSLDFYHRRRQLRGLTDEQLRIVEGWIQANEKAQAASRSVDEALSQAIPIQPKRETL